MLHLHPNNSVFSDCKSEKFYKHIGVFYRGHVRTWNFVKEVNFYMFDKVAENVDYYFTTWDDPSIEVDDIKKDFQNYNLVKFLLIEKNEEYYNPYHSPAWMKKNILPFKHKREKEIRYDAVIDIRPDVLVYKINCKNLMVNTYYTEYEHQFYPWPDKGVTDILSIMTSDVYDKLALRCEYKIDTYMEPHLRNFLISQSINIQVDHIIFGTIIRPSLLDFIYDPLQLINGIGPHNFNLSQKFGEKLWSGLSKQQKIDCCEKYKIDINDYILPNEYIL